MIQEKQKNAIKGVIYRHPCMDENSFIDDYIEPLNEKLQGENKKLFRAGDFNFVNHPETLKFFETMVLNQLLPSINKN